MGCHKAILLAVTMLAGGICCAPFFRSTAKPSRSPSGRRLLGALFGDRYHADHREDGATTVKHLKRPVTACGVT